MAFAFEKLKVYQKAVDFADEVAALTEGFPRGYGFLADQLNRASLSIAANIAEGNGRFTKADRKNFFGIARGSVQECVPLLELARRRQLLEDSTHVKLKADLEEIARMLSGPSAGWTNGQHERPAGLRRCSKRPMSRCGARRSPGAPSRPATGPRTARRLTPRSTRPCSGKSEGRATNPALRRSGAGCLRWPNSIILLPEPRPPRSGLLRLLPKEKPDARRQSASAPSGLIIQRLAAEPSGLSCQCRPTAIAAISPGG